MSSSSPILLVPATSVPAPPHPRAVLATWDEERVVVWQAHGDAVADEALSTGRFGGASWRVDRLTRFRLSLPSLLARNGWGVRPGRERILAVSLSRAGFDALLRMAVHAEFEQGAYASRAAFHLATRYATATFAWHPDADPSGAALPWDTIRFGLRDDALRRFTSEWVVGVEDWTPWVAARRPSPSQSEPVPLLRAYPLPDALAARLAGRRS